MLGEQMKKFLQLCKLRKPQPKTNVFVEVLVLNVMVRRRLTRKDLLHVSIGSLLLIVTAFIITYGVLLHQVDRKLHLAHVQAQGSNQLLNDAQNRHTKRVKFKFKHRANSDLSADIIQVERRIAVWKSSDFDGKISDMPDCLTHSKFLVLITSAPQHFQRRSAIRKTWCNPYASEHSKDSWQCVFVIGRVVENNKLSAEIEKEKTIYRDILHGSYIDSYRNLTYKVQNSLSWSKNYCPTDFVLKTDDDCFVNSKLLYSFLTSSNKVSSKLYVGKMFLEDSNREVIRNEISKWHVAETDFSNDNYPTYASGTGYIMSQDVVSRTVEESMYHTPIPIEDAYTGIVIHALKDVEPLHSDRFMPSSSGLTVCNYLYMFVTHKVPPEKQFLMHNYMMRANSECPNNDAVTTWF